MLFKIYKELSKPNNKKMKNLIKKIKSKGLTFTFGKILYQRKYITKENIQMTNRHLKRYSTSFVMRVMQI